MYSLAMIVRNCAEKLDNCLSCFGKYPDEIVIVNTGIDEEEEGFKETNAVAEKHGARVLHFPWCDDFSKARQFSFDNCSNDYVMWLDTDDTVKSPKEFDRAIRAVIAQGVVGIIATYKYEFDDEGRCTTELLRERIVNRHAWEWRAPIHECLCLRFQGNVEHIPVTHGYVEHDRLRSDTETTRKNLERNLSVFEANWPNPEECETRMKYYWGNTLFGMGRVDEAIPFWDQYIEASGNKDEVYVACCFGAEAMRIKGNFEKSLEYTRHAIGLMPQNPSAHHQASETYCAMSMFDEAVKHATMCLERQAPGGQQEMVSNPKHLAGRPHYVLAFCHANLGNWDLAEQHVAACREVFGQNDETIGCVADQIKMGFEMSRMIGSFKLLSDIMVQEGRRSDARVLAQIAPKALDGHPLVVRMKPKKRDPNKKTIAWLCAGGYHDPWGPDSPEKGGIGGSEEAVINMAREFAKLGWNSEIYNPHVSGVRRDGVSWLNCSEWGGETDPVDVAVHWRMPQGAVAGGQDPGASYLWLHDVPTGGWQYGLWNLYDKIFVLSEFHKELHEQIGIPSEKLFATRNGMDPRLFTEKDLCENDKKKFIWGSCPSRGLVSVLQMWPQILEIEPEAELHIFYGWGQTFMVHMKEQGPEGDLAKVYEAVNGLKDQKGVTWHGRVDQKKLNRWYAKCGTWLYPTRFPEISCITAMKAQAHGCFPICTDEFALSETVTTGVKLKVDPDTIEGAACFLGAVESWLRGEIDFDKQEAMKWRSNTWEALAKEWEAVFLADLAKGEPRKVVRKGTIPPWMASSTLKSSTAKAAPMGAESGSEGEFSLQAS
jgi:glycosyltransferase involved in cell wall biosynthesis